MTKRILIFALLHLFPSALLAQVVEEQKETLNNQHIQYSDTLTLTERPEASVAQKKNNIFRKFYRYFAESNENKKNKRFDFSIIGGPHYASDTKLGLGLVAGGTYRMRRDDYQTPRSNISLYGDITTTGFYLLGIRGNNIFPGERFRIDYSLYFFSMPSCFWGIGYQMGNNNDNASKYLRLQNQIKVDFLVKVARNTYLGPSVSFDYVKGKEFTNIDLLNGQRATTQYMSTGVIFSYDSRDFIPNAFKGLYVKLDQRFYPGIISNTKPFYRTTLVVDTYNQVWKGGVIATDVFGEFNYGHTIWSMISSAGGSARMRGYYEGRYRDNNVVTAQVELRQKMWGRNGFAVWVGAGNVFRSFDKFSWQQTLPNYGIGYRWEFKKRMNVRLDYGFGKSGQSAFMFSINEAF